MNDSHNAETSPRFHRNQEHEREVLLSIMTENAYLQTDVITSVGLI